MKNINIKSIFVLICTLLSFNTYAYDFKFNGICYTITSISDLTVKVDVNDTNYSGDIVIPESVEYSNKIWNVTSIASLYVFAGSTINSITIPGSIKTIPGNGFKNCYYLRTVNILDGVTSIQIGAFDRCHSLTSITIPESVTAIESIFRECTSLITVIFPNTITSIADGMFRDCTKLKSFTIPNSCTSIGGFAFQNCSSLTTIIIPGNITSIGNSAFSGCANLSTINSEIIQPFVIDDTSFGYATYLNAILNVPSGTKVSYMNTGGWKNFTSIVEPTSNEKYLVTVQCNTGGKIAFGDTLISNNSYSREFTLNDKVLFSITPEEGYKIGKILLNDIDVTSATFNNNYVIEKLIVNTTLKVYFEELPIYITIQHADNGYIQQQIIKGNSYTYRISPATDWKINSITFNGEDVSSELTEDNSYTTPIISNNSTLNITFETKTSAVNDLDLSNLKAYVSGNIIVVANAKVGELISVYEINGKLLKSIPATGQNLNIQLPKNNIYIITNNSKTVKVKL